MSPKFARGTEALEAADAARGGGGGSFTPFVKIAADEKKYLQFVTPMDEITGALIHQYVIVAYKEDTGKAVFANFISPRDKAVDGPSGSDPLQDRFGLNPSYRLFAVAVELEPTKKTVGGKPKITGFEPKMRQWTDRDGEDHSSITAGVVVQAKANFFGHLSTWEEESDDQMTNKIWSVSRDNNIKQPTYTFVPSPHEPLDLSPWADDMPDVDAWMQEIADPARLAEMIDPLPDDFRISAYPGKGKPAAAAPKASKPAAKPVEDDEPPFETDEQAELTKAEKFKRLREKTKGKSE